jgi:hypothetical protein
MTEDTRNKLLVAAIVNVAAIQAIATSLGAPRWVGTVVAGGSMVAASQPKMLPPVARGAVNLVVLPGRIAAEILVTKKGACCKECAARKEIEP